jgi:hypothetical protein
MIQALKTAHFIIKIHGCHPKFNTTLLRREGEIHLSIDRLLGQQAFSENQKPKNSEQTFGESQREQRNP